MLIHLIRHTTPKVESGICYGNSDLEVTNTFNEERDVVLSKLSNHYDVVFTSPLSRCAKLAGFINSPKHHADDRLKEYNFGDWRLVLDEEKYLPMQQVLLHPIKNLSCCNDH